MKNQVIETDDNEMKFFYDKKDLSQRNLLVYAKAMRVHINECEVNGYDFTELVLLEMAEKLGVDIREMTNKDFQRENGPQKYSKEDTAKLLKQNPHYINTPIAISQNQAKFIKTERDLWSFDKNKNVSKSDNFNP
jgi:arsenate reductase-like glutaredoxin family protein